MSGHSPGPWKKANDHGSIYDADGKLVATCGYNVSVGSTEDDDNAHLIKASTCLLRAAEASLSVLDILLHTGLTPDRENVAKVRAITENAILRALGKRA